MTVTRSVEATGATVEEAAAGALAELGVGADEAQVDVIAQPRRGFFGGGRLARVRATVRSPDEGRGSGDETPAEDANNSISDKAPTQEDRVSESTADADEMEAEASTDDASELEDELSPEERLDMLDEEAEIAADFIEGLLDLLDLPGDIEIQVREEQAIVNISEVGSGLLIGRRGATLDALQELVRCATQRRTERRSHVRVDVEGYRERQLEKLRDKCRDAIAQVRESQEPVRLEPMDPYERKMMHDLVAKSSGVVSSSEGSEPRRRVVISPES